MSKKRRWMLLYKDVTDQYAYWEVDWREYMRAIYPGVWYSSEVVRLQLVKDQINAYHPGLYPLPPELPRASSKSPTPR